MLTLGKPQIAPERENLKNRILDKFEMPKAGNDIVYKYVRAIKAGSPLKAVHVAGITFQNRCLPPEATLRQNSETQYDPITPSILLTEKQAKAVLERAKKTTVRIPNRLNPKHEVVDGISNGEPKEFPSTSVCYYDEIILEKVEKYANRVISEPMQDFRNEEKELEEMIDEPQKIKKELYKQQGKKK